MTAFNALAIVAWAHHSWFDNATPARSERARARAASYLLARVPSIVAAAPQLPWFATRLTRPLCARLMRVCAALACARSLRLVVSARARSQFSISAGLPPLAALQSHPRGDYEDMPLDTPVDFFSRRSLNVAGLALALRAVADDAQRQWLRLRLPRDWSETAATWRLEGVSPQEARELVEDASRLIDAGRASC